MGDLIGYWRFGGEARSLKEFVQPDTPMVRALHQRLTEGLAARDDIILACWDFVAREIAYPASDRHTLVAFDRFRLVNSYDFFEFPPEALTMRMADCDGSAFLLLSLLRRSLGPGDAWGVIGDLVDGGEAGGHAWVVARRDNGGLYVLETTLSEVPPDFWFTEEMVAESYVPSIYFNDQEVSIIRETAFPLYKNNPLRHRILCSRWGCAVK